MVGEGGLTVTYVAGADVQKAQGRGPNTRPGPSLSHAGHPSIYLIIHNCKIHIMFTCDSLFGCSSFGCAVFTHVFILRHMSASTAHTGLSTCMRVLF